MYGINPTDKKSSDSILNDIFNLLGTIDGISTADAARLGTMIIEYGNYMIGEAMRPMLESIVKAVEEPKDKWKQD